MAGQNNTSLQRFGEVRPDPINVRGSHPADRARYIGFRGLILPGRQSEIRAQHPRPGKPSGSSVREVGVHDFRMATKQQLFHLDGSLLGVAPSAVGIDFRWKVGFANNLAAFPASRVC